MMNKGMDIRWAVDITKWRPSGFQWAAALGVVQSKEQERIRRFLFKRDAKASLVGQLMLHKLVRDTLNIPNSQVALERSEKGKPYLTGMPLQFNVSHQGSYTVLAASKAESVGIDVMRVDTERFNTDSKVIDFFHTMRRQFTSGEWASIRSGGSREECLRNFYRHWCLKESYVKAVGVGITVDLLSMDFSVRESISPSTIVSSTRLILSGQPENGWTFEEQMLDDKHCVCVALKPSPSYKQQSFKLLEVDELLVPVAVSEEECDKWSRDFECKEEEPTFY